MLRNQADLKSGEREAINNVLKDWQDVMDVLTQPTREMPEPGSWRNARGVLKPTEGEPTP